jgi:hypothetical protein
MVVLKHVTCFNQCSIFVFTSENEGYLTQHEDFTSQNGGVKRSKYFFGSAKKAMN